MLEITRNRRYFLSFDEKGPAIRIGLHKSLAKRLALCQEIDAAANMRQYRFDDYERCSESGFGFNKAITGRKRQGEYYVYSAKLVRDESLPNKGLHAPLASIVLLLDYLNILAQNENGDPAQEQLLIVRPNYQPRQTMSGFTIGGAIHPKALEYCRMSQQNGRILGIERAMWLVASVFSEFPGVEQDGPHPYANCETLVKPDGHFSFDFCSAAGVSTSYTPEPMGLVPDGYAPLVCSNGDGPLRQLAWFAALAKLHDLVDAEYTPAAP